MGAAGTSKTYGFSPKGGGVVSSDCYYLSGGTFQYLNNMLPFSNDQGAGIHVTYQEMVEKAKREVEHRIRQEGERAVLETNVHGLNNELVKLLGRLYYRTSYRQNVLMHSIEVSKLCGVLASELGVDANLARRAGLLHDIGLSLIHI